LSELFVRFLEKFGNKSTATTYTLERVLNEIMLSHYDYLYYDLKLRQLAPYVRISTTYYDYALSVNNLVAMIVDDLREAYVDIYGTSSPKKTFRFNEYLRELSTEGVNIMEQVTEGVWRGDENIFRTLFQNNPLNDFVVT
jgi:hypothetical protein